MELLFDDAVVPASTRGAYFDGLQKRMLEAERSQGPLRQELTEVQDLGRRAAYPANQLMEMMDSPVLR